MLVIGAEWWTTIRTLFATFVNFMPTNHCYWHMTMKLRKDY